MGLLVNVDVDDLQRGIAFYTAAFRLTLARRVGDTVAELAGFEAPLYLIATDAGSRATPAGETRRFARHWTPVHLDVSVPDVEAARDRAVAAGATLERDVETTEYGRIARLSDPFGHGFCLIEFSERGYDEPG